MKPEQVADVACKIGEGPLWNPDHGLVYWVDIPRGRLYSYDPLSHKHRMVHEGRPIGGFTIQADGSLLLFMNKGRVAVWNGDTVETVVDSIPGSEDTLFNDVIADPEGRVFAGMKAGKKHAGQLYRLDTDGSLHLVLDDLGEPNGMGFTPDGLGMYFTDTDASKIYQFDYDRASGNIKNQRVFVQIPAVDGIPDGMTVDAEGCVWSAMWNGGQVMRFSPTADEMERVEVPVAKPSSVTFGGEGYADMYISTSGGDDREHEGPAAGSLFRVKPEVRGVPEFRSRVGYTVEGRYS